MPSGWPSSEASSGFSFGLRSGETLFQAEAKLLIRPVTDAVFESNLRVDQIINTDTEAQLAASEVVASGALTLLGDEAPAGLRVDDIESELTVAIKPDTQIVVIRFRHADPDIAGAITDAVAESYLLSRTQTASEEKERQSNQLAGQISELTRDLTAANITIATADTEVRVRESLESRIARLEEVVAIERLEGNESAATGDPIGELKSDLATLDSSVDATQLAAARTTVELIKGQISDLRDELIKLLTLEIDGGSMIQQAGVGAEILPTSQTIHPAIGALVGLMLGIATAVAVERGARARSSANRAVAQPAVAAPIHHSGNGAPYPSTPATEHAMPPMTTPTVVADHRHAPSKEVMPDPATWGIADPEVGQPTTPVAPVPPPAQNVATPNGFAPLADVAKIPRSAREPVVITEPDSEPAVALSRVAAIIANETSGVRTPSILITSPRAHEGRTTVATNIAAALRNTGRKVLLVTDSDGRVIAPGVHILPPGMHLGPDSEFPDNVRLPSILEEAKDLVDYVIIDGPPALANDEAARLAGFVDIAVIVAATGRTSVIDVTSTKQRLEHGGTRVVGVVTTARPSWLVRRIGDRSVADNSAVPSGFAENDAAAQI